MEMIRERIEKASLPYEPISDGFITAKEFAKMLGISTRAPGRRVTWLLCMAAIGDNCNGTPAVIKECFAGQNPVVHIYKSLL